MQFDGRKQIVKSVQTALGLDADGVDGAHTWTAIAAKLGVAAAPVVLVSTSTDVAIGDAAYKLILKYEVGGGASYYNKALKNPCYPGGESGVTIGIGIFSNFGISSSKNAN